mgnify:CR=1 FL=1
MSKLNVHKVLAGTPSDVRIKELEELLKKEEEKCVLY